MNQSFCFSTSLPELGTVFLENWSLYHYVVPFLSQITFLSLKSDLSEINMAILAFFWLLLAWYIFLHPFTLNLYVSLGTSLVAQWLRICLPMQGTRVWALVREDPTCHGATKPVHHSYWSCTLEPMSHNYWSPCA